MGIKTMIRYYIFLFIILSFSVSFLNAKDNDIFSKEFKVKPNTKYTLSFQAKVFNNKLVLESAKNSLPYWEIKIFDSQNRLPYDGYLKYNWQHCNSTNWKSYQQTFYTPENGEMLQFVFLNSENNSATVKDIKLEKAIDNNILINSDFSGGKYNYSGWNELNRAKLIEVDGVTKLKIDAGGYALTDPVPIKNAKYRFVGMSNIPEILFYNSDMLTIDTKKIRTKTFIPPKDAKYLRFFFPKGEITKISLQPLTKGDK